MPLSFGLETGGILKGPYFFFFFFEKIVLIGLVVKPKKNSLVASKVTPCNSDMPLTM